MGSQRSRVDWASVLARESGFCSVWASAKDTKILFVQRFVRLYAYGITFLILAQYLSSTGISDDRIGLFMTLTLLGDTVISTVLTIVTDRLGRRYVLAAGAALMALSGIMFHLSDNYWILLAAGIVGVISPSGNEIGPFRSIEESILAQLTDKPQRSDIFAWYALFGTAGAALGALSSGWFIEILHKKAEWSEISSFRAVFLVYTVLGALKLALVYLLSPQIESQQTQVRYEAVNRDDEDGSPDTHDADEPFGRPKPSLLERIRGLVPYVSPPSRAILLRLIFLFFIDSSASGMASPSWLSYFFTTVHALQPGSLGTLFLVTNLLATLSNFAALPLARRLGPLKTMVFTHLPSAIFLALIPWPSPEGPGTWLSMAFLALRSCTQSMDQAPRQAFLTAAVLADERTAILGIVNTIKTLAQAAGIGMAGVLANRELWVIEFSGAGALKAVYDLLVLWMFHQLKDREDAS